MVWIYFRQFCGNVQFSPVKPLFWEEPKQVIISNLGVGLACATYHTHTHTHQSTNGQEATIATGKTTGCDSTDYSQATFENQTSTLPC